MLKKILRRQHKQTEDFFVKILSLLILGFSLSMMKKISKTIIKRYAAIGSPYPAPRFRGKHYVVLPPFMTQLSLPFNKKLIKSIKYQNHIFRDNG